MENPQNIVFWLLAGATVISALMVVSLKNIFHCALALIGCLFSVAGIFILLEAEFLAAAQVLIYVGAIAILMLFAIMLTSKIASKHYKQSNENAIVGGLIAATFCIGGVMIPWASGVWNKSDQILPDNNVKVIGKYLMTDYMLPFEVISVLLIASMIGAIVLARKERS